MNVNLVPSFDLDMFKFGNHLNFTAHRAHQRLHYSLNSRFKVNYSLQCLGILQLHLHLNLLLSSVFYFLLTKVIKVK